MRRYGESTGKAILFGTVACLFLSLVFLLAASIFAALEIGNTSLPRIYPLINYLAAVWGGIVAAKRAKRRGYLVGSAVGLIWSLFMLLLSSTVGTVKLGEMWGKVLLSVVLGAIGGMWGVSRD